MARKLSEIAKEIIFEVEKQTNKTFGLAMPHARPYINAMLELEKVTDKYYADDGESIVIYALSNLSTWRGESARRLKAELKQALKDR